MADGKDANQPELKIRRTPSESSRPADILARYESLPPHIRRLASRPDWRLCTQCNHKFYSADVFRIRICEKCKQGNPGGLREIPIRSLGVTDSRDQSEP